MRLVEKLPIAKVPDSVVVAPYDVVRPYMNPRTVVLAPLSFETDALRVTEVEARFVGEEVVRDGAELDEPPPMPETERTWTRLLSPSVT